MEQDRRPDDGTGETPSAGAPRPGDPPADDRLSAFVLAVREALLGMPLEGLPPGAEEIRAQVARLKALERRFEAREAEAQRARDAMESRWAAFVRDALPKLQERLAAGGLKDIFDFQRLLEEVRRILLEAPLPPPAGQEALLAQETARLQAETVRLLEARRKLEARVSALQARCADAEAGSRRETERASRLEGELGRLELERQGLHRRLDRAEEEGLTSEWGQRWAEAEGEASGTRRFQDEFRVWSEDRERLKREILQARSLADTRAAEARRLEDELRRALEGRHKANAEALEARAGLQGARDELSRTQAELERARQAEAAAGDRLETLEAQTRDALEQAHRADADLETTRRLQETQAAMIHNLEQHLAGASRARAELEAALRGAQTALQVRANEAQARALELQAREAELKAADDARTADAAELSLLKEELQRARDAEAALRALRERHTEAEARLRRLEPELEQVRRRAQQHEADLLLQQEQLARLAAEARTAEGALEQARQDALEREMETKAMAKRASQASEERALAEDELLHARRRAETAVAALHEHQLDIEDVAAQRRKLGAEIEAAAQREGRLQGALRAAEQKEQAAVEEAARLRAAAERAEQRADALYVEGNRASGELRRLKEEMEMAVRELTRAREEREAGMAALILSRKEVTDLRARVSELEGQLEMSRVRGVKPAPPSEPVPPVALVPADGGIDPDAPARAFEILLSRVAGAMNEIRRLAGSLDASKRASFHATLARLSAVQDQFKAASEYFAHSPEPTWVSLSPLVEAALKPWDAPLRRRGIAVTRRLELQARVLAHPDRLRVAIYQLLRNAYDALPKGGALTVEVEHARDAHEVILRLSDTGPGLPARVLERLTPFSEIGPVRMGLGLPLARRIAEGFGGRLRLSNAGGARVELVLPATEES